MHYKKGICFKEKLSKSSSNFEGYFLLASTPINKITSAIKRDVLFFFNNLAMCSK